MILVANEMAKEKIPEELGLALVLTVYEAKGLEFDDVLLYNFFTDSEVRQSHWILFTQFRSEWDLCSVEDSLELRLRVRSGACVCGRASCKWGGLRIALSRYWLPFHVHPWFSCAHVS